MSSLVQSCHPNRQEFNRQPEHSSFNTGGPMEADKLDFRRLDPGDLMAVLLRTLLFLSCFCPVGSFLILASRLASFRTADLLAARTTPRGHYLTQCPHCAWPSSSVEPALTPAAAGATTRWVPVNLETSRCAVASSRKKREYLKLGVEGSAST